MSSILTDVKHKIGPSGSYDYFDLDIVDAINEAFAVLCQIGIGPSDGFAIADETAQWDDFVTGNVTQNLVKQYVYTDVRIIFDPPNNSTHLQKLQERLTEIQWRLNIYNDPKGQEESKVVITEAALTTEDVNAIFDDAKEHEPPVDTDDMFTPEDVSNIFDEEQGD